MACILRTLVVATVLAAVSAKKVEVSFQGKGYNVTSGCPSKNPEVLRWHQFCTALWGEVRVCANRGLGVTRTLVPKYSNICDALCHVSYSKTLRQCPSGSVEALPFPISKRSKVPAPSKVILEYLGSGYLVTSGCKTRDSRVKRFYSLCVAEYEEDTVCRKDNIPGLALEFPEYTDVCSAMCHHKELRGLSFCPVKGQLYK